VGLRLELATLVFLAALAPGASATAAQEHQSWRLGGGFTATVYVGATNPGSTSDAQRTLKIHRRGRTIRRFNRRGEGLGIQMVDITRDAVKDVLVLDYQGGSGACGIYRLFGGSGFGELWVRPACADWAIVRLSGRALIAWTALNSSKTAASKGNIHCCWTKWRRTEWRWRRGKLARSGSTLGSPPPSQWRQRLLPGTFPRG
jgi:hypothetical protein